MDKKIYLIAIFFIALVFVSFFPNLAMAQKCECTDPRDDCGTGLVPCGRTCDDASTNTNECCDCNLCHIFILVKRIIDYLTVIAVSLLAVMGFVAGIMYITAHGNPDWITRARQTITAAVIGFIIVITSWGIVNTIVVVLSGNSAGEIFGKPWNAVDCNPDAGGGGGTSQLLEGQEEIGLVLRNDIKKSEGNFVSYDAGLDINELSKFPRPFLAREDSAIDSKR